MTVPQIVTQHVVAAAVCLLGLTAAPAKRTPIDGAPAALDAGGPGAVKVGMSVGEAERVLGLPLSAGGEPEPGACRTVEDRAGPTGAAFEVVDDRAVRADVWKPRPQRRADPLAAPAAIAIESEAQRRGRARPTDRETEE